MSSSPWFRVSFRAGVLLWRQVVKVPLWIYIHLCLTPLCWVEAMTLPYITQECHLLVFLQALPNLSVLEAWCIDVQKSSIATERQNLSILIIKPPVGLEAEPKPCAREQNQKTWLCAKAEWHWDWSQFVGTKMRTGNIAVLQLESEFPWLQYIANGLSWLLSEACAAFLSQRRGPCISCRTCHIEEVQ